MIKRFDLSDEDEDQSGFSAPELDEDAGRSAGAVELRRFPVNRVRLAIIVLAMIAVSYGGWRLIADPSSPWATDSLVGVAYAVIAATLALSLFYLQRLLDPRQGLEIGPDGVRDLREEEEFVWIDIASIEVEDRGIGPLRLPRLRIAFTEEARADALIPLHGLKAEDGAIAEALTAFRPAAAP